ncbi:MAG: hypothetical protein HDQ98_16140 [Lachnospiraceae bacterium]|nr:hypothetical protein [Lachnospiraceae bacterium]MBD5533701.1 hypothetical protein [Lachnospiraceae bacterium]
MFDYWFTSTDQNGFMYSCDMLRYRLEFRKKDFDGEKLRKVLCEWGRHDIKDYPLNTSEYKYRNLFTISYDDIESTKRVMTVGVGFNGTSKEDYKDGFIEVNPNKCFSSLQCLYDFQRIVDCCWSFELVRFDLAIDLPIPREALSLSKDGRKYAMEMHSSSDKTEYLGGRNNSGYVKLYNKGREQGDDTVDLSRLEMTCDAEWTADQIVSKLPYVNTVQFAGSFDQESDIEVRDLSSTQRALVRALRTSTDRDEIYKSLSANIRVKLRPYIYDDNTTLVYDTTCVQDVINGIRSFEQSMKEGVYLNVTREQLEADKQRNKFVKVELSDTPFYQAE